MIDFRYQKSFLYKFFEEALTVGLNLALEKIKTLTERQGAIESSLAISKNVGDKLRERIVKLERELHASSQYSRRECLELIGIPISVPNDNMEDKVCQILSSIGVSVTPNELEACHRLKNKDRTIVKFVNRKTCVSALKNRRKLKETDKVDFGFPRESKLYLNESLCPYYRGISRLWTYNGMVTIKISEDSDRLGITHDTDLFCVT